MYCQSSSSSKSRSVEDDDHWDSDSPNSSTSVEEGSGAKNLIRSITNGSMTKLARKVTFNQISSNQQKKSAFEDRGIIEAFKSSRNGHKIQIHLKFHDMSLRLPSGVTILDGVTGEIQPGRFTAIMGPSGCGKTTFLNVLLGKIRRTAGELFINEVQADLSLFKKLIGYVPQDDTMLKELTGKLKNLFTPVRENLLHSNRVRAPSSWSERDSQAYINALLRALQLDKVAESVIGDEVTRGISGGQKKRVNIGMELAGLPVAIFLDEPTSGLDSTAALNVASILKNMSKLGLTTVAVIHQPRTEIFNQMDDILLLLPGGKTGYLGPREHIVKYFENLGYEFNPERNPADILMDIVSLQAKPKKGFRMLQVDDIAHEWEFYKLHGYHMADAVDFGQNRVVDGGFDFDRSQNSSKSFSSSSLSKLSPTDSRFSFRSDLDQSHLNYKEKSNSNLMEPISEEEHPNPIITDKVTMPELHRTLTRTMTKKKISPQVVQEASQEELLLVCRSRGASFLRQFLLCFRRSIVQQYRRTFGIIWEFAVAGTCGFLVGLGMKDLDGVMYRGVVIAPFSAISAAPLESFVPQCGLILGMGVCIAAAPAGVNVFGPEIINYYRESAAGHSKLAYFLAKTLAALPRIAIASLHMCAVWIVMTTPMISFEKIYAILLLNWYGIYGIACVVSLVLRRENQAVLATLAGFIPTTFAGYGPSIPNAIENHYDWLINISYARWAVEALYSEELTPFRKIYQVDAVSANTTGYTLDRYGLDIFIMFLLGTSIRVIGYFVLIFYNRKKQI